MATSAIETSFDALPLSPEGPLAAGAFWLKVGTALTALYMIFGLLLIGVPGLSRGGFVVAVLAAFWALFGLASGQARFQHALWLPVAFYAFVVSAGFMMHDYPFEYVAQVTTIWLASISIGLFAANGMSHNVILAGFALVAIGNAVAIAIGYDGFSIHQVGRASGLEDSAALELKRFSGLAAQVNTLAALIVAPLFVLFLRNRGLPLMIYLVLVAVGLVFMSLTGSRAGFAAVLLFVACGAFFLVRNPLVRTLTLFAGGVLVAAGLLYAMNPNAIREIEKSSLGEQEIVQRIIEAIDGTDGSAAERERFRDLAWGPFMDRPFTGHGPNAFSSLVGNGTYAHNSFSELAVNFGMAGLLLWYGMFAVAAFGIFRSPYKMPAVSALAFLFLMDQSYVGYVERSVSLVMCLTLAYCGRSVYKRRRTAAEAEPFRPRPIELRPLQEPESRA